MRLALISAFLFVATLTTAVGCGGEVEERFDCRRVCQAYADCVDSDYDVSSCVDSCDSQDLGDEAESCDNCIDERSCSESVFACGGECAAIVP